MGNIAWALLWPPAWAFSFSTIAGAVGGKRFACGRCGANVFSRAGENFTCNGCGVLYGSGKGRESA